CCGRPHLRRLPRGSLSQRRLRCRELGPGLRRRCCDGGGDGDERDDGSGEQCAQGGELEHGAGPRAVSEPGGSRCTPTLVTHRQHSAAACRTTPKGSMHARRRHGRSALAAVTALGMAALLVWTAAAPASAAVYTFERIGGADRFATSSMISERMPDQRSSTVFLASGVVSPDALAAAPVAAAAGAHLLLTDSGTLREPTRARLAALRPSTIVIVGGMPSINGTVEA